MDTFSNWRVVGRCEQILFCFSHCRSHTLVPRRSEPSPSPAVACCQTPLPRSLSLSHSSWWPSNLVCSGRFSIREQTLYQPVQSQHWGAERWSTSSSWWWELIVSLSVWFSFSNNMLEAACVLSPTTHHFYTRINPSHCAGSTRGHGISDIRDQYR